MGACISVPAAFLCGIINATLCACSFVKCCCTGGMGPGGVGKKMAKFLYVVFLGIATIAAYTIGRYGENEFIDQDFILFEVNLNCESITGQNVCTGDPAIYRASCACVMFFALMWLGTMPRPTFSGNRNWEPLLGEGWHRGWWGIKSFIFFGLLVSSFFWPASFFNEDTYKEIARFVSVFFLAVQVLVLIDFAYSWNDNWIERAYEDDDDEPTSKGWLYALLICAGILYVVAVGGLVALFIAYQDCGLALTFCIVTASLFVLYTGLSFCNLHVVNLFVRCACRDPFDEDDEQGVSIAPASVVGVYCTYLLWSALRSNPDPSDECNPYGGFLERNGLEILVGICFAAGSLVWTSFAASNNAENLLKGSRDENEVSGTNGGGAYQIGEKEDGTAQYASDVNPENYEEEDPEPRLWLFQFLMLTASFYMAMVLTNWGVSNVDAQAIAEGQKAAGDVGVVSMYVKLTAQWVSSFLFMWTLVAPYVFEDREW